MAVSVYLNKIYGARQRAPALQLAFRGSEGGGEQIARGTANEEFAQKYWYVICTAFHGVAGAAPRKSSGRNFAVYIWFPVRELFIRYGQI